MPNETILRIVDAMEVKFHHAHTYQVRKPFQIYGAPQTKSILFTPHQGYFTGLASHKQIEPGSFYLIPKGTLNYSYMGADNGPRLDPFFMATDNDIKREYMKDVPFGASYEPGANVASSIGFELLIHGVVNIFQVMGLPLLIIPPDDDLNCSFKGVMRETSRNTVGSAPLRKKHLEMIMIYMMRHLSERGDMQETMSKLNYILDRRLVDVVEYIQTNLEGDLSNIKIAQVACVTKDYVGQFFKSLTGRNLQDYVEERRLERAYQLIRTTDDNIQQIASRVGFKDPAYFSRRFKMKFEQNAKDVRKPFAETVS